MSRGRPATKSPTSWRIRLPVRLRKQDLPQTGQGRCVKLRLRSMILALGRSSDRVTPSVTSGKYRPGPDTAKPSLANWSGQGIYRICRLSHCQDASFDAKDSFDCSFRKRDNVLWQDVSS